MKHGGHTALEWSSVGLLPSCAAGFESRLGYATESNNFFLHLVAQPVKARRLSYHLAREGHKPKVLNDINSFVLQNDTLPSVRLAGEHHPSCGGTCRIFVDGSVGNALHCSMRLRTSTKPITKLRVAATIHTGNGSEPWNTPPYE